MVSFGQYGQITTVQCYQGTVNGLVKPYNSIMVRSMAICGQYGQITNVQCYQGTVNSLVKPCNSIMVRSMAIM